jgi:hypothetical protein
MLQNDDDKQSAVRDKTAMAQRRPRFSLIKKEYLLKYFAAVHTFRYLCVSKPKQRDAQIKPAVWLKQTSRLPSLNKPFD